MQSKIIEATNVDAGGANYGKFMVSRFDAEEWSYQSVIEEGRPLLAARGWSHHHIWVADLQTGEAALFAHGGMASADLHKHKIWVCPLFQPFLEWLYQQDVSVLDRLPTMVALDAESALFGYRREGPEEARGK